MDFFKPGSVTIKMITPSGELIDLGGLPDFLAGPEGEAQLCDCPPGVCMGEDDGFDAAAAEYDALDKFINSIFGGPADDEFDGDEDFEPLSPEDKVEAVAQLGRIAEDLTKIVGIHANLLKELIAS